MLYLPLTYTFPVYEIMSSTENSACASTHEEKVAQATDASISVSSTDHDPQPEWIEGVKLWSIMTGLMIACFLILLDTSIIGTVRIHLSCSDNH